MTRFEREVANSMSDSNSGAAVAGSRGLIAHKYLIVFFGALVAIGPLSIDMYLPAMPAMADEFGVSIVSLNNTLSVFLLGYALGQLFGGSFSDQIGRKRIGYIGMTLYVGAALAITLVHNVEQMLVLRVFQALGGGFTTVIAMASVRDSYSVEELGRRYATVMLVVLVSPLIAPALGAFLLHFGWRAIFLAKASYASLMLLLYIVAVPETRPGAWSRLSVKSIFTQCYSVVTRRIDGKIVPIRYSLAMALATGGVLMTFVTNASFVYMEYFGVTAAQFPILFGISVLGFMSMNLFSMKRLNSSNTSFFFRRGLMVQGVTAVVLMTFTLFGVVSLWTVVPAIAIMMGVLGLVGPAGSARYLSFFSQLAGSASSVHTTLMFSLGGLLGGLTGLLYNGTLMPIIAVMTGAALLSNTIASTIPAYAQIDPTNRS